MDHMASWPVVELRSDSEYSDYSSCIRSNDRFIDSTLERRVLQLYMYHKQAHVMYR